MPANDLERLKRYLAPCQVCQNYLEKVWDTLEVLGHIPLRTLSSGTHGALLGVLGRWKAGKQETKQARIFPISL
jgi:hypothetical protein